MEIKDFDMTTSVTSIADIFPIIHLKKYTYIGLIFLIFQIPKFVFLFWMDKFYQVWIEIMRTLAAMKMNEKKCD